MTTINLIFSTCPDQEIAEAIASRLLEQQLAACISILPGISSIYRWQGEMVKEQEVLLLIKSANERVEELLRVLADIHPYEVPEIISLPVENGFQPYIEWVSQCTISS